MRHGRPDSLGPLPHGFTCIAIGILLLWVNLSYGGARSPLGRRPEPGFDRTPSLDLPRAGVPSTKGVGRPAGTGSLRATSLTDSPQSLPRQAAAMISSRPPETAPSDSFTDRLASFLARLGRAAPLAFVGLFVLNTVLCLPTALMSLAGGFLFGAAWGALYVWFGAMLGASAAFGISRHWGQTWIQQRIARRPWLLALEQAVSEEGWKIIVLSRLAPGSPFFILNYLFGLTRVRFRDYFWSTAISVFPGSFLLVYLGSLGQRALAGHIRSPYEWALYGVGLIALGAAVWLIARRAHGILNQKLGAASQSPPRRRPE